MKMMQDGMGGAQNDTGGAASGAAGCCGGTGRKEIYPFLMSLPALTVEQRAELRRLSEERIDEGTMLSRAAQQRLDRAVASGDHDTAYSAIQQMRDGVGRIGSGVAVHKLLQEGTPPQTVASQWFKREMDLPLPLAHDRRGTWFGILPFHLFTMALLVAFVLAMIGLYVFKMRRTAALFGRIEPDGGAPPPGGAPPLAGAPKPPAPPGGGASPPPAAPAVPAAGPGPPAATAAEPTPAQPAVDAPVKANWHGPLRIGNIVSETPSVKTVRLQSVAGDGPLPFTFLPGQFMNVAFSIGGARMNRSYSISSSPNQRGYVELSVRREPRGAVSRHIDDLLEVGDEIEAGGPVGKFTFDGTEADSIVLIAGGVGITPMMSIARYLSERSWPGDIFFIYACRTPTDYIFAKEIAELQRTNPKLHMVVAMSNPEGTDWKGPRGRITKELLTHSVPDLISRRIHICGPPMMMDAVKALLSELGVPAEQVKSEQFGAVKPGPGATGTNAKFAAPATGPLVTFSKNDKAAKIHEGQTVLELSEELAIGIEFSCRVGTCGVCKVKMTAGEVEMAVEDALDADDKSNGMILACQAKPKGPVSVEA